ncbi:phage host-nuclease inhibitor protein Gam [Azospirillum agricola]|nr:phage host-nuclease inhibitor protein Gam [Azospirillum agricola]
MAALQAAAETRAAPLRARIEALTARLESWATRRRIGRARSITLTTGRLCWHPRPDSLAIADEAALVRWLQSNRPALLRNNVSIDQAAILADPDAAATLPGVTIRPGREAFVVAAAAVPPARRPFQRHEP